MRVLFHADVTGCHIIGQQAALSVHAQFRPTTPPCCTTGSGAATVPRHSLFASSHGGKAVVMFATHAGPAADPLQAPVLTVRSWSPLQLYPQTPDRDSASQRDLSPVLCPVGEPSHAVSVSLTLSVTPTTGVRESCPRECWPVHGTGNGNGPPRLPMEEQRNAKARGRMLPASSCNG